ncbi:MAG TPA: ATP-binding protein [Terriglobia bacterium]|nr:ATP-binding protein [Terriglobia bacterium]
MKVTNPQEGHTFPMTLRQQARQKLIPVGAAQSWLAGLFICAVVILLVAGPLVLHHKAETTLTYLNEQVDPADKLGGRIKAALSHELSGILGFQVTGKEEYAQLYREQLRIVTEAIAEGAHVVPQLDTTVQTRFAEMRLVLDSWHQEVETSAFVTAQLPVQQFREALFQRDDMLQEAHTATGNFTEAVETFRTQQRQEFGSLARLSTMLSIIFAVLAVIVVLLVATILRRLHAATETLEARAKEEEALRQVAHTLTGAFTLNDVLRRITETACSAGSAESVFVKLINEDANELTCVAGYGAGVPPTGTRVPYRGSIAEETITSAHPQIVLDVTNEWQRRPDFSELAAGCNNCTAMVIPLIAQNSKLGALFLIRRHPKYFTEAEFPRVTILANMASVAIQRAAGTDKIRKMEAEERFLSEAASILASSLDYGTTLRAVVQLAVPRFGDWCVVSLLEDETVRMVEVAHTDPAKVRLLQDLQKKYPPRLDREVGVIRVLKSGQADLLDVSDELLKQIAQDSEHYETLRQLKLKSTMVVPLGTGGETFGTLTLGLEEGGRRYDRDDLRFAEDFGRHIALAIQNSRLYTAAEHALRARDEVLRVVSHDLRNPIGNIQMTARMLAAASMPEDKRRSMVDIINRAAGRMNRLIEDLIAVARIRGGQVIPLNLQAENPGEIIAEACELFAAQARTKSIELKCEKPTLTPTINVDRHRLFQVLSNILDNAIKFTPEGGSITVSCEAHADVVEFAIADTGRGIAPENLNKIFDLFWQEKITAHMGAGFGLAIAKTIIEEHGGRIWAESTPGLGTTFFFTVQQFLGKADRLNGELTG